MKEDVLELTRLGAGNTESIRVVRGSFQVLPGALAYRRPGDPERCTTYIPLSTLERFK